MPPDAKFTRYKERKPSSERVERRTAEDRPSKRRRSKSPSRASNSRSDRKRSRSPSFRQPGTSRRVVDNFPNRERDERQRRESDAHRRQDSSSRHRRRSPSGERARPVIKREERDSEERQSHTRRNDSRTESASRSEPNAETRYGLQNDAPAAGSNTKDVKLEKPNFGLSGKLLEDTNMVNGVVIAYSQPDEARQPKTRWRLYPFKGDSSLPTMYIHRQSAYLLGRDRRVVDIPIDHPSCSKQHAVIQYRLVPVEKEDGTIIRKVKPYIIDLGSANGTFVNGKRIESQRFVELLEKDSVKFGFSSREYIMLHEGSKDEEYHTGDEDGDKSS